jgi:hypothetical protein
MQEPPGLNRVAGAAEGPRGFFLEGRLKSFGTNEVTQGGGLNPQFGKLPDLPLKVDRGA